MQIAAAPENTSIIGMLPRYAPTITIACRRQRVAGQVQAIHAAQLFDQYRREHQPANHRDIDGQREGR